MKHFSDARADLLQVLHEDWPELQRVCLIFDLSGRCRVLAEPRPSIPRSDLLQLQHRIEERFKIAAGPFWGNEVWLDAAEASPSQRVVFELAWARSRAEPPEQDRTYILDRRYSKDAWLGTPLDPPWPDTAPNGAPLPLIVSFFSFKGGVGRTTLVASMAIQLARAGKRVAVLDFDLESPGIGTLLRPASQGAALHGVVDFLLERALVKEPLDITDYLHICDAQELIRDGEPMTVVPCGSVDPDYLEKLARVNYESLHRSAVHIEKSPLHALLKQVRSEANPDYVLIDSRAGLHDLGGLSLSGLAHWHVLLGLGSDQSWQGLNLAIAQLGRHRLEQSLEPSLCLVVHAMSPPPGELRDHQVRVFRDKSYDAFCENYYPASGSTADWELPDSQSTESSHFPSVLSWDSRVFGYSQLDGVADFLCEGEYKNLVRTLLERMGRS